MQIKYNSEGLIPAIIQDHNTSKVLMMGYMNEEAIKLTFETKKVTFFSRSKQRIWVKGESSGHFLNLVSMSNDCDDDTLLIKAIPDGPTCHTGSDTCWDEANIGADLDFLIQLECVIDDRFRNPTDTSYTTSLVKKGINKVAQKVGEEAVELVIESKDDNKELFIGEAADLLFHYLILLRAKDCELKDVVDTLKGRHSK